MQNKVAHFIEALGSIAKGSREYYIWIACLGAFMAAGLAAYLYQLSSGFIVTNIRDQVSWGFYISNFTFLVGVAAAAVLLVIPAYLYHFKPIKEVVFLGEMMAITAIIMCIMFVTVDLGHPERAWHLIPFIGRPNFPQSLLTWDVLVLNGYLVINATVFFYIMYKIYEGKDYSKIMPLILLSIPWAVSIHTVTAFLYNGLVGRPYWNASILAPRFLASAFCSGPAIMILVLQAVRRLSGVQIDNRAIIKIAEMIAFAMCINIFLMFCEMYKEFYSGSIHAAPLTYLYFGLHGHSSLVIPIWISTIFNFTALGMFIYIFNKGEENFKLLNIGCVMIIIGIYIEKGIGVVIPGFTPDTLGEIYDYMPTWVEIVVALGIWSTGAMIYTFLFKFSLPVYRGDIRLKE